MKTMGFGGNVSICFNDARVRNVLQAQRTFCSKLKQNINSKPQLQIMRQNSQQSLVRPLS